MKSTYFFAALPTVIIFAISSYAVTHAFFSNSATSTSNTFTASAAFPTPTPITNHVVISEVQTATLSATTSDFIELYNPTNAEINLDPFRIVKRTDGGTADTGVVSFSSSDKIPAHGFFLWASSDSDYDIQIHANVSTGANIASDNSIALRNGGLDTGTIIDAVRWGNPAGSPFIEGSSLSNPLAGQSLERKSYSTSTAASMAVGGTDELKGNGYDTDDNINDFIDRLTPQPQNSSSVAETP